MELVRSSLSELSNGRTAAVLPKSDRAPVIIKRNRTSYMYEYQQLSESLRPS